MSGNTLNPDERAKVDRVEAQVRTYLQQKNVVCYNVHSEILERNAEDQNSNIEVQDPVRTCCGTVTFKPAAKKRKRRNRNEGFKTRKCCALFIGFFTLYPLISKGTFGKGFCKARITEHNKKIRTSFQFSLCWKILITLLFLAIPLCIFGSPVVYFHYLYHVKVGISSPIPCLKISDIDSQDTPYNDAGFLNVFEALTPCLTHLLLAISYSAFKSFPTHQNEDIQDVPVQLGNSNLQLRYVSSLRLYEQYTKQAMVTYKKRKHVNKLLEWLVYAMIIIVAGLSVAFPLLFRTISTRFDLKERSALCGHSDCCKSEKFVFYTYSIAGFVLLCSCYAMLWTAFLSAEFMRVAVKEFRSLYTKEEFKDSQELPASCPSWANKCFACCLNSLRAHTGKETFTNPLEKPLSGLSRPSSFDVTIGDIPPRGNKRGLARLRQSLITKKNEDQQENKEDEPKEPEVYETMRIFDYASSPGTTSMKDKDRTSSSSSSSATRFYMDLTVQQNLTAWIGIRGELLSYLNEIKARRIWVVLNTSLFVLFVITVYQVATLALSQSWTLRASRIYCLVTFFGVSIFVALIIWKAVQINELLNQDKLYLERKQIEIETRKSTLQALEDVTEAVANYAPTRSDEFLTKAPNLFERDKTTNALSQQSSTSSRSSSVPSSLSSTPCSFSAFATAETELLMSKLQETSTVLRNDVLPPLKNSISGHPVKIMSGLVLNRINSLQERYLKKVKLISNKLLEANDYEEIAGRKKQMQDNYEELSADLEDQKGPLHSLLIGLRDAMRLTYPPIAELANSSILVNTYLAQITLHDDYFRICGFKVDIRSIVFIVGALASSGLSVFIRALVKAEP